LILTSNVTGRRAHLRCRAFGLLFLLGVLLSLLPTTARAQTPSAGGIQADGVAAAANKGNEAAAEKADETAVYKKSASVRAIGKLLHLSPDASSSLFEYLNFAILAGVVLFYGMKLVPKIFRDRQTKIDQQLVEARTATDEANERLKAVEARLGRLDHEIEELRQRAEQEGAGDEQRIKQSIEEERKKIVAAAEQEISVASSAAERSLRVFAADLAMARATGQMQLTENQDRTLVHDFAAGLQESELQERRN
jgi:F-type H+-transporting ATPase subunit b